MFDISFGELMVVGAVALVVIGPERLPKVARTVGALLGRMQRYVASVKADIKREVELDGLRELEAEMSEAGRKLSDEIRGGIAPIQSGLQEVAGDTRTALSDPQPETPAPRADDKQFDLFAPVAPSARPERDQR
ncbi:Sec-independent protein translocase protein TatB [Chitinimonas sp. BJB300]|uniref:Sec-independent protein translocase protein TatB n=1 Tax=Chitinimonas sp. BJB300 TaxID=1559339 RepID=UPI000C110628|nr:Sec-independent protein translocase protein TatB [Chitinimonas sp. BJB300]PHV11281.1 twin-arginine translocase subunit TatB [Chitinimonas sp. BJB300]TSJ91552.1 twin-arginine translocase subunit TatB [Chitinimonas sp. BJB300]